MAEGLEPSTITSSSDGVSIQLHDILVGKTVLCSGQSNIQTIVVSKAFNATAEIAAAGAFPHVRIANTAKMNAWGGPLTDLPPMQLRWTKPNATNIVDYSATCWFAARDLFLALGGSTAVGVVQSAVGGTAVRNWCVCLRVRVCACARVHVRVRARARVCVSVCLCVRACVRVSVCARARCGWPGAPPPPHS